MAELNLLKLKEITDDMVECIKKLQEWNLIPQDGTYLCQQCKGGYMKLVKDSTRKDGWVWLCGNKKWKTRPKGKARKCASRISIRTGTFFENSKLPLFKILAFALLWCDCVQLKTICKYIKINPHTAVDWASYITNGQNLGGQGIIVEIDESKFGKRKYHRGRYVEGQWVFGGYEIGTGKVFMVAVENRGADTLIPLIQQWIKPGTIIISDFWKAYDCLKNENYEHLKVNHKLNFKDPDTLAYTNSIEASWRAAKAITNSSGRNKIHIPGNLARYMFNKHCIEKEVDRTELFFRLAGELYSPLLPKKNTSVEEEEPKEDRSDVEDEQ